MTTDLRTRLASADPAKSRRFDDAELDRLARAILASADEILATADPTAYPTTDPTTDPTVDLTKNATTTAEVDELVVGATGRPRRATRRRAVGVFAVAAALAAGVLVVPSVLHRTSAEHREAAALLDGAADSIDAHDPPARGDQYWQITSSGFGLAGIGGAEIQEFLVSQQGTSFVAVDGSRPTIVVSEPSRVLRQLSGPKADGPQNPGFGVSALPAPNDAAPSWQAPTPAFLAALPRDPADLLARIRADSAGSGNSADGEVVVTVADVLRSGLVPADLRAALYRALARVPGVVVSAEDATVDGTDGVAFAYDEAANGIRQELIVDPATGVLVGEREVATREFGGIPAGTVIGQATSTRTLVDAIPATVTAGGLVFHCVTASDASVTCSG